MVNNLSKEFLNICRVVNCNYAVAVRVGCNELIRRKLNQLRNELLNHRCVIDSDIAGAVRVADEELAGILFEGRLVGRVACCLCYFRRPAVEFISYSEKTAVP